MPNPKHRQIAAHVPIGSRTILEGATKAQLATALYDAVAGSCESAEDDDEVFTALLDALGEARCRLQPSERTLRRNQWPRNL